MRKVLLSSIIVCLPGAVNAAQDYVTEHEAILELIDRVKVLESTLDLVVESEIRSQTQIRQLEDAIEKLQSLQRANSAW